MLRDAGRYVDGGPVHRRRRRDANPHRHINRRHATVLGCWGYEYTHLHRAVAMMARHRDRFGWRGSSPASTRWPRPGARSRTWSAGGREGSDPPALTPPAATARRIAVPQKNVDKRAAGGWYFFTHSSASRSPVPLRDTSGEPAVVVAGVPVVPLRCGRTRFAVTRRYLPARAGVCVEGVSMIECCRRNRVAWLFLVAVAVVLSLGVASPGAGR